MRIKKTGLRLLCLLLALLLMGLSVSAAQSESETQPEPETATETSAVTKQYARDELVCTYTFTTYGYGHGVGMSQLGAAAYADTGGRFHWNYVQILLHYYPQTHMAYEEDIPAVMTRGGVSYNTRDYLAHTTYAEIGSYASSRYTEAVKAQIVAVYTFLKNHGYSVSAGSIAYTSKTPNSLIYDCVDAVIGQYVAYENGSAATGLFSASFPSWTASSGKTWGGSDYTGLSGGLYSPETVSVRTVTMDAQDIVAIANTYNAGKSDDKKIHLSGDPSTWLEIVEHDGCYSENIGYVTKLRIGDQTMSGNAFRTLLFRVPGVPGLRSHCFSLRYDLVPGQDVPVNEPETTTPLQDN